MACAQQDWRAVMYQSLARLEESDRTMDRVGFTRRRELSELNADGSLKSQTQQVFERRMFDGQPVTFLVERDGQPIANEERLRLEAKVRQSRVENAASSAQQSRPSEEAWIREFPDALEYSLIGEELIDGRKTWILRFEPRKDYKAKHLKARVFEKLRGRVWVDQIEKDMVRAEGEVFDTVSVGFGVLGRIDKGTRLSMERRRLPGGVWMTSKTDVRYAVRVMLFKYVHSRVLTETYDFKRLAGSMIEHGTPPLAAHRTRIVSRCRARG